MITPSVMARAMEKPGRSDQLRRAGRDSSSGERVPYVRQRRRSLCTAEARASLFPFGRAGERARAPRGLIALQLGQVAVAVALNQWSNAFYNALQEKDWSVFAHQLILFAGLASAAIVCHAYQLYFSRWLQIRWRRWMSEHYLQAWLSKGTAIQRDPLSD